MKEQSQQFTTQHIKEVAILNKILIIPKQTK